MSSRSRTKAIFYLLCGLPVFTFALIPPHWPVLTVIAQKCAALHLGFLPSLLRISLFSLLLPSVYFDKKARLVPGNRSQTTEAEKRSTPEAGLDHRAYKLSRIIMMCLAFGSILLVGILKSSWDTASLALLLLRLIVFSAALLVSLGAVLRSLGTA